MKGRKVRQDDKKDSGGEEVGGAWKSQNKTKNKSSDTKVHAFLYHQAASK